MQESTLQRKIISKKLCETCLNSWSWHDAGFTLYFKDKYAPQSRNALRFRLFILVWLTAADTEVSPIKCDVRECVVRTSGSRECVVGDSQRDDAKESVVGMADSTVANGTFYRNRGKFWRMWRSNDTFSRIWRSNDTFSNVTFYRRDLRVQSFIALPDLPLLPIPICDLWLLTQGRVGVVWCNYCNLGYILRLVPRQKKTH